MNRSKEASPERDVIPDEEEKLIEAEQKEEQVIEEQMDKQEKVDDADLKALKEKLKTLKEH